MSINDYSSFFNGKFLMGPNSLRILDELLSEYPLKYTANELILDLGCGTGLTSYFICRETGARVVANDLWISEEDNAARFAQLGVGEMITPVQEDAAKLKLGQNMFDAVISVDSYHYFAGTKGYFAENIMPCLKAGGTVLISVPGIKDEYDDRTAELLSPWLGDEAGLMKSPRQWKELIETSDENEFVRIWELGCFSEAWSDWLGTDNEYAKGDLEFFDSVIKPYTCLAAIAVRKRNS